MSDVHASPERSTVDTAHGGHPLLSLALAAMMDDVGAHSGAMYLLTPDEPVLEMAVIAGLPRSFAAPWERVALSAPIPVSEAVRGRRLVWVNGEEQMARRYPRLAMVLPYPFAMAALPVATHDTTYGAVFLTWPGSHPPELSDRERDHLTSACDRLAMRLRRAEEEGRPVRPEPDLSAPSTTTVAGTLGTVEAARMVARLPYGMCALDLHGRITFANAATAELLGIPVSGLLGTQLWASVPWLNDPAYEDRYRAALMSQHVTSFVALRPPSAWLSFRLYPGTNGLSVRISRARAVAEAEHAARVEGDGPGRLVTINNVLALASALTEAVGVQDVVELVADEIVPAIGSQALVMLGSRAGRLHVLGHRGYADPHLVERFDGMPLTAPTPGAVSLTTGVPAFFETRQQLEHLYPMRQDVPDGLGAWAYLPLIASGRPVGTWVLGYADPHPFPADERAVLTSLSGFIAQALERALLYDAKHQLAHGLQQALLPHSLPSIPGIEAASRYLPATRGMDIGGDFFDLVLSHGRASAVIGDVQGHNVTAAGLMGQIRTAVRAYTTVGQAPEEVMSSTNRLLIDLGSELFASCLYLRLDPEHGKAVMARAGHPPPLLRRPDGKVRVLDLAGGPLLGIDAAATYPTTEVALAEGSVLALYTDGLIESPGVDIEDALAVLGERLARAGEGPLDSLADSLVRETEAAQERADDVALLLLRATGVGG
ncbi:SpoIIE family protein phosphatase [Streptomyces europaeiscabiei]|uniref:SpoIIE family protein phosphatase n=1 Tax=Streptomyces europaeiscabiei TaxID=146819 RepID=A0ABU4NK71_9ACTN|nr:SpoIIE family protein phosphatase [Streptomyces europaeiscabiei]MDX2527456.1 SpoIIE family protein phosphatase [Streptomyces europaeiscabiei]MDX2763407.1 SpoIIE family protein phosphatase [Streptomyces europaeiscabiei]MDX2773113.1 SpoIIE family protein phosphatase [Streptomyces europaeiscabiei]MDX3545956.1 SpoIIE family protein phosphatase [Streptomyces europaeiscabiei]MDX3555645.1 SpoIIE family protein phosphatase [Streptomyces europaeiscabiei]